MIDKMTPKRTEKLQIMLNDVELQAIDDWRFEHRLPTRAAAIRELIRRGLQEARQGSPTTDGMTSQDFSVVDPEAVNDGE